MQAHERNSKLVALAASRNSFGQGESSGQECSAERSNRRHHQNERTAPTTRTKGRRGWRQGRHLAWKPPRARIESRRDLAPEKMPGGDPVENIGGCPAGRR